MRAGPRTDLHAPDAAKGSLSGPVAHSVRPKRTERIFACKNHAMFDCGPFAIICASGAVASPSGLSALPGRSGFLGPAYTGPLSIQLAKPGWGLAIIILLINC
jgi:hypothetical protein